MKQQVDEAMQIIKSAFDNGDITEQQYVEALAKSKKIESEDSILEFYIEALNHKKEIGNELAEFIVQNPKFAYEQLEKGEKIFQPYVDSIKEALRQTKTQYADGIIYNTSGRVLMLLRTAKDNKPELDNKWSLPGGHVDEGETPEQAVIREVLEETNLLVDGVSLRLVKEDDKCIIYYYTCFVDQNQIEILDAAEHKGYRWVDRKELQELDCIFDLKDVLNQLVFPELQSEVIVVDETEDTETQYHNAFAVIKEAFDGGLIDEDKFLKAKQLYEQRLDELKKSKQQGVKVDVEKFLSNHTQPGNLYELKYNGKTFYVARHGETEDNVAGRLRSPDTKLTKKGKQQIIALREEIKKKKINPPMIISSSLPRAVETAWGLYDKADVKEVDWLVTWDLGEYEGKIEKDYEKEIEEDVKKNPDKKVGKTGESFNEFKSRIISNLKKCLDKSKENTILVTHSSVIKMIQAWEKADHTDNIDIEKIKKAITNNNLQLESDSFEMIEKAFFNQRLNHKYIRREGNAGNYKYIYKNENEKEYAESIEDIDKHKTEIENYIHKIQHHLRVPYYSSTLTMPDEVIDLINDWKIISKSPYSDSFYDTNNKTWDNTPEGSLRLADHWNFYSQGTIHCKTNTLENIDHDKWVLAKWNSKLGKKLYYRLIDGKRDESENYFHLDDSRIIEKEGKLFLKQNDENINAQIEIKPVLNEKGEQQAEGLYEVIKYWPKDYDKQKKFFEAMNLIDSLQREKEAKENGFEKYEDYAEWRNKNAKKIEREKKKELKTKIESGQLKASLTKREWSKNKGSFKLESENTYIGIVTKLSASMCTIKTADGKEYRGKDFHIIENQEEEKQVEKNVALETIKKAFYNNQIEEQDYIETFNKAKEIEVPDKHEIGMKVLKGGSCCANCEYVSANHKHCSNEFWIEWNEKSTELPEKADEYCCDFWNNDEIKKSVETIKEAFDANLISLEEYQTALEKTKKLNKSKKGFPIGTLSKDKRYIKTASGWDLVPMQTEEERIEAVKKIGNKQSKLVSYLDQLSKMNVNTKQKAFFEWQKNNAKQIHLVHVDEIRKKYPAIDEYLKVEEPEIKQCYKNATELVVAVPEVEYVEGFVDMAGIPIEHAWNKIGDEYFDVTNDIALAHHTKTSFDEYMSIVEMKHDELLKHTFRNQLYGNMIGSKGKEVLEGHNEELKKSEESVKIGDEKTWHGRKFKYTTSGWSHADDKNSALKTEKQKDKQKIQDFSDEELDTHAERSSLSDLQKVVKESRNPKLREVAAKHLANRQQREKEHTLWDLQMLEEVTGDKETSKDNTIYFDKEIEPDLKTLLDKHSVKYAVHAAGEQ